MKVDLTWTERGKCYGNSEFLKLDTPQQKKVCAGCPVTAECLAFILPFEEKDAAADGWPVYGGLNGGERQRVRRRAKKLKGACGKGHPYVDGSYRERADRNGARICIECDNARKRVAA